MEQQNNITFRLALLFLVIPLIGSCIKPANAFCMVKGYVKDSEASHVDYSVEGYCENAGEKKSMSKQEGRLWQLFWGGFEDSCESYCKKVWISATDQSNTKYGHPVDYPLTTSNTEDWDKGRTIIHWANTTLTNNPETKELIDQQRAEQASSDNFQESPTVDSPKNTIKTPEQVVQPDSIDTNEEIVTSPQRGSDSTRVLLIGMLVVLLSISGLIFIKKYINKKRKRSSRKR